MVGQLVRAAGRERAEVDAVAVEGVHPDPVAEQCAAALAPGRVDGDDGDPELGFFSPWSWWPVILAAGAASVFLGLAVGIWIAIIGGGLAIIALVGWTYEYYRGYFAR